MYIELAILVITGDGEIIDGHFLPFYLVTLSLMNLEKVKGNKSYFKQEKTTMLFLLFTLSQSHSHFSPFKGNLLNMSSTDL